MEVTYDYDKMTWIGARPPRYNQGQPPMTNDMQLVILGEFPGSIVSGNQVTFDYRPELCVYCGRIFQEEIGGGACAHCGAA